MRPIPARQLQATRDRLLRQLRYRQCTVDELAVTVGLTANGVRAQLSALERDGLVERVGVRHGARPGKPPQLYRITAPAEAACSSAYAPALGALVATLGQRLTPAELHLTFTAAGRGIARGLGPQRGDPADTARTLLETLGAAASVHEVGGHVTVEGEACPLADAVRRCPDSCEMVRAMLAAATGAKVTTRCHHGDSPRCRFAVGDGVPRSAAATSRG